MTRQQVAWDWEEDQTGQGYTPRPRRMAVPTRRRLAQPVLNLPRRHREGVVMEGG